MVRWLRWHCPPDTGFEIRALAVWGRARYLSVTEAPHNTDFHTWMGEKHFFVSFKPPRPGTEPRTLAWKAAVLTTTLGPPPYRARIDAYFQPAGSWAAAEQQTGEWLQIQLESTYSVGKVLIMKQIDLEQYPEAITVKTAHDDLQWRDVIVDQTLLYTDRTANLWFPILYTTPIWRIYITAYYDHPAMKCDLIGFRNDWWKE